MCIFIGYYVKETVETVNGVMHVRIHAIMIFRNNNYKIMVLLLVGAKTVLLLDANFSHISEDK